MQTCSKADIKYLLNPISVIPAIPVERPYKCEQCPRAFRERGNLNKHTISVHRKHKAFRCVRCPKNKYKSFAFKDGLVRHITTVHDNRRRYLCGACDASFKQQSHLAKHARTVHKYTYK